VIENRQCGFLALPGVTLIADGTYPGTNKLQVFIAQSPQSFRK